MHGGRRSDTSVNELLNDIYAERPNSFAIKPQIKNYWQFSGYVFNFTHEQKIQNKNNLCVYFKKQVISFSNCRKLVFIFDLKTEPDSSSFFVLATKLFHIAGPPKPTLRSLVFGVL